MKKKIAIIVAALFMAFAMLPVANVAADDSITIDGESYSYDPDYQGSSKLPYDTKSKASEDDITDRVITVINTMALLVGIISVIMIIWGGFSYTTSMGDPSKATRAKMIITSAIVGLVLSLLVGVIANVVVTLSSGDTI